MKRFKESGASYRRKKQAKIEFEKINEGALLKFINTSKDVTSNINNESIRTDSSEKSHSESSDEAVTILPDLALHTSDQPSTEQVESEKEITTTSTVKNEELYDIGKWPDKISDSLRLWLVKQEVERFQHLDTDFRKTPAVMKPQAGAGTSKQPERRLSKEWFYRQLNNGEKVLRKWMIFSPSKNALFCFCCRLFGDVNEKNVSNFCSSNGFNTWWKLNPKVSNHELSPLHGQNFSKWKELEFRHRNENCIDNENQNMFRKETKKWEEILLRLFDIIKFLAKQNLPLRGHREDETSENRGNFLELVNFISNYDPVLREHLVKIKFGHKIAITYLSPQIQNEFINILGEAVRKTIIRQIKKAKYFSLIFDSTPDISHKDQTSQVLRYIVIENEEVKVVESFIDFIETDQKDAKSITDLILNKLKTDGLDIMNCRGQAYDNASVMAGKHAGVQQRLKDINPNAEFISCSNHSLNLACLHAATVEINSVTFFGVLERCYAFFSMSTHRWQVLISTTGKSLKRSQDTRWSARGDAVEMIWEHYKKIITTLEKLSDREESINTRTDAAALLVGLQSFSFLCFLGLWTPVLKEINDAQNYLQKKGVSLCDSAHKINSLQTLIEEYRDKHVDDAFQYAKNMCTELGISLDPPRRIKSKRIFGDGSRDAALTYEQELRRQMFSTLDKILNEIEDRFKKLKDLAKKFNFLTPKQLLEVDDDEFANDEIDKKEFQRERLRLRTFISATGNKAALINSSPLELFKFIIKSKLEDSLPNLLIMMRIFLTIAISNASCERSFSKLKIIKNYLRSTMSTVRLTNLAILSIEREITDNMDMQPLINNFAEIKARKISF